VSKYRNTLVSSSTAAERFFQSQEYFLLMMKADPPLLALLGQSVSGLNFYDDIERSPLAD
jgi:hypothetical protein